MSELIYKYWGKAKPSSDAGPQFHLLPYHCLDVAAVGRAYLQKQPRLMQLFCQTLALPPAVTLDWLTFLLALHDLGKFSEAFQGQKPELFLKLHGCETRYQYIERHDSLGDWLWDKSLVEKVLAENFAKPRSWRHVFSPLIRAVTGHHGQPPKVSASGLSSHFSRKDENAALAFVQAMQNMLLPQASIDAWFAQSIDGIESKMQLVSWWLAGVAVLADWLGSNTDFFPYCTKEKSLAEYWLESGARAENALLATGVLPQPVATGKKLIDLFPALADKSLTPLQNWAETVVLDNSPQLFLLEDVTGAGKTEAAITLAYRLMECGAAEGIFVGLPTMATANAMYRRVQKTGTSFYAHDAHPSLLLAHGHRHLSKEFNDSIFPASETEADSQQQDETASARCAAWLADHNKKALLASVGVGTIDQALLAVLHSKHQSLRLLGLIGKVLVVDEVHACDAYMQAVLERLLSFHAAAGGSVILLSATLPFAMKASLIRAYAEGRKINVPVLKKQNYPLATHMHTCEPGVEEFPLATRIDVCRRVDVIYQDDEAVIERLIRKNLNAGKCICWVRNTVGDAITAFNLFDDLPQQNLYLFHARFTMGDRLGMEETILDEFGPNSFGENRKGKLVIATQVIEQSLDVDFDVLISDLAPIDRLIQRAGRLQRHTRNKFGDRINAADERGAACMIVHAPQWTTEPSATWVEEKFPGGAAVYPHHGQLWLTGRALQRGGFSMPDDARDLIEGVYGEEADEMIPQGLRKKCNKAEGNEDASRSVGRQNSLPLTQGYKVGDFSDWWREAKTPTRLGEESVEVRLLRWQDGKLRYWSDSAEDAADFSTVRINAKWITPESMPMEMTKRNALQLFKARLPDDGKWSAWLVLEKNNGGQWLGDAVDAAGKNNDWIYCNKMGLRLKEKLTMNKELS